VRICEYGCGQEATHQFKNGRWCCSKYFNSLANFYRDWWELFYIEIMRRRRIN